MIIDYSLDFDYVTYYGKFNKEKIAVNVNYFFDSKANIYYVAYPGL